MNRLSQIAEWLIYGLFFVFCLFPLATSPLLGGVLLCGLIRTKPMDYKKSWASHSSVVLLFLSFFLIHLLSLLYTEDLSAGWKAIEIKLSFVLVPLLFLQSLQFRFDQLRIAFISGLVLSSIICIVHAFSISGEIGIGNAFAVSRFSFLVHPSYFGAMLVIGLCTLYCYPIKLTGSWSKAVGPLIGILFLFSLYSTTSKQAFISLLLVAFVVLIREFVRVKSRYLKWSLIVIPGAVLCLVFGTENSISNRFKEMYDVIQNRKAVDRASAESNSTRVLVWDSAIELICENPIAGVGAGDGVNALIQRNNEKGFTGVVEKKYNAHSQFLTTAISVGSIGLFLLLLILLWTLFKAIKTRNLWAILLVVVMVSSLSTESFLEKQAGVVPFVLFVSLVLFNKLLILQQADENKQV